ncbi:MAG TPA: hypothetical protein VGX50_15135, partial [Longimicrobium sp.]|nr:hypothetical protein [Longimicrobium sp.]
MPSTIQFPGLYPDRTQSPPALPRRFTRLRAGVREALGVGALVVAAMLPFLASPHPGAKPAACVTPVNLGGRLHVTLNCDSHLFLLLAEDPRRMLTEEYRTWQSRPLYGALGWTLAMPFRAAGLEQVGERRLPPTIWASPRGGRPATRLLPWYGGFILLNALLLAGAVMLFRRLAGARSYRDAAILLPVPVLLANELTRAFFWTPHLQMFNVFVPVLSLWLFC